MKNASLIAAAGILVVSNASILLDALYNRLGPPDADITMTQLEVRYFPVSANDEDSGVTLTLVWTDPAALPWPNLSDFPDWVGRPLLQKLGFDCSLDPSAPGADRFYQRQRPRQGYVALEFNGPAWRFWREAYLRSIDEQNAKHPPHPVTDQDPPRSHLMAIDADSDRRALRARHPDRGIIVLPAVISIVSQPYSKWPLIARIDEIPTSIHVPRPFSARFTALSQGKTRYLFDRSYRVSLRFGALLEPWVTGVEIE